MLEQSLTRKQAVIDLLTQSFRAVRGSFSSYPARELEGSGEEATTLRRIYLRLLVHTHEHMGQAIAYARTMGIRVPWPDPVDQYDRWEKGGSAITQ